MLVKFNSDAGALIMFGDVARKLLRMMGQSGDVPGALLAKDVPAALERLRGTVAKAPGSPEPAEPGNTDEPPVSMRQRAFPLIELLARAAKRDCDVLWDEERSLIR